jgi:hypothetical protein
MGLRRRGSSPATRNYAFGLAFLAFRGAPRASRREHCDDCSTPSKKQPRRPEQSDERSGANSPKKLSPALQQQLEEQVLQQLMKDLFIFDPRLIMQNDGQQ